ncbi:DUF2530 domain-containing protein [Streptomyces hypolithicus]
MAKWTPQHEAPEPLEGPVMATVVGGTIVWFALFLVQLPFYGWYDDRGWTWWVWTFLAGAGLGLIGIWYVRGREAALRREAEAGSTGSSKSAGSAGSAEAAGSAQ